MDDWLARDDALVQRNRQRRTNQAPKGQRSRSAYVWRLVLEFWISLLLEVDVSLFAIPVDSVHKHVSSSRFLFTLQHWFLLLA